MQKILSFFSNKSNRTLDYTCWDSQLIQPWAGLALSEPVLMSILLPVTDGYPFLNQWLGEWPGKDFMIIFHKSKLPDPVLDPVPLALTDCSMQPGFYSCKAQTMIKSGVLLN